MPLRRDTPTLDPPIEPVEPLRLCEWPGCPLDGDFRAPRSPTALRDYRWFCLDHVRIYNLQWDYFAGKSQAEIEAHQRADVTWHRPTWRFSTLGFGPVRDPFDLFADADGPFARNRRQVRPDGKEARMLAVLDLQRGGTLAELKRRYKELAKRHHPDLHGGDRQAEERLKLINEAYTYLRGSGLFT